LLAKFGLHFFPSLGRFGRGVVENPVELSLMPVWDWYGFWAGGEAVPDLTNQIETLLRGELENLIEQWFRGHESKIADTGRAGKTREALRICA
jgi:hypothetical protein